MGFFDGFSNLFSGNTNTNTNTTNRGTSSAESSAQGATNNTSTVDPRYGYEVGNAFGQVPGLFQPGRGLVQGAAAPTTFGQISPLLNPYAQAQYQANAQALQPQFQDQLAQLKGSQSANPYASSNSGAEARLRGQQANTLGQLSGNIFANSYGQALGAAQTDASRALQAGNALNTASTQQLGLVPSLVGAGGQTTAGSGTTSQTGQTSGQTFNTGTSNGTTTYNPSIASIAGGIGGLFLRDGGAVPGYESGGAVKSDPGSFAGKVEDAFHAFHRMRKHAESGGRVEKPGYDDGGWVTSVNPFLGGPPSSDDSYWNGVQSAAIANGNPTTSPFAPTGPSMKDRLDALGKTFEPPKTAAMTPLQLPTDNPSLGTLGNVMGSVGNALRPRAAAGGTMGNDTPSFASTLWGGLGRLIGNAPEVQPSPSNPARDILRENYDYEKPDARWQLRRGLLGMSSGVPGLPGPFSSFGNAMDEELKSRSEAAKVLEQHAQMMGRTPTGQPTLAAQQAVGNVNGQPTVTSRQVTMGEKKLPAEIAHLEATSEPAMIRIKAIEQANTLHAQRLKSIDDMEFIDKNPVANAEFYRAQREAANIAHQAALQRLQGSGASAPPSAPAGVKTWNPNLPNGGL